VRLSATLARDGMRVARDTGANGSVSGTVDGGGARRMGVQLEAESLFCY
jgi:lysophospholipase L1-like esterase